MPVRSGVPQGTYMGPVLLVFLCYINYITNTISSQLRLYADDALLYREIGSSQDQLATRKSRQSGGVGQEMGYALQP